MPYLRHDLIVLQEDAYQFAHPLLVAVAPGAGDPSIVQLLLRHGGRISCFRDEFVWMKNSKKASSKKPSSLEIEEPLVIKEARRNGHTYALAILLAEWKNRCQLGITPPVAPGEGPVCSCAEYRDFSYRRFPEFSLRSSSVCMNHSIMGV